MMSPPGSDLPAFGFLRDAAGTALIVREGSFRSLAALLERRRPELVAGEPALLLDRLLRAGPELVAEVVACCDEAPELGAPRALSAPIAAPGKIVALGRTFPAHARELGNEPPPEPLVFGKLGENLRGSGAAIELPDLAARERYDNEIELALLLGRPLRRAETAEAQAAIAAYTIANDFTWRSEQDRAKKAGQPWFLAKNLPGALPCGPALVPASLLPEPLACRLVTRVDGAIVQDTDYRGLCGSPAELLAWLSRRLPLAAGDMVLLGTPAGVSSVRPGAKVEAAVAGLGVLRFELIGEEIR